jgi:hypothetical protein
MQFRKHAVVALAATAAAVGSMAVGVSATHAAAPAPYHVVTVHVNNHRVLVGKNNTIGAGRTLFHVVTHQGDHQMNIVRLRKGYSPPQFAQDIGQAFQGNVKAVRRVDKNSVFRGGAEARPGNNGAFSANLGPNTYYFFDSNSNSFARVRVVGKMSPRTDVRTSSLINIFTYGFGTGAHSVAHHGWTLLKNRADQPHFIEFQQVKESTTATQVKKYFKGGARGRPSWGLSATEGSGVISPTKTSAMYLNLPAGKYLVACFWPDDNNGMPHAFMGMWKLIHLK